MRSACHTDPMMKEGLSPAVQYPRVPCHKVASIIDEVGKDVSNGNQGKESLFENLSNGKTYI
jgi:D-arabinose 1-dehydrogenase-like Zn-dependent alcohol dehydrogenase